MAGFNFEGGKIAFTYPHHIFPKTQRFIEMGRRWDERQLRRTVCVGETGVARGYYDELEED